MFELLTGIGEYGGTLVMGWRSFYVLFALTFLSYLLLTFKNNSTLDLKKVIVNAMFIYYLLSVIRLAFFPIDVWPVAENREIAAMVMFDRDYPWTLWEIMSIDFIPFRTIYHTLPLANDWFYWFFAIRGILGNFILLFPFAIFIGLLEKERMNYKKAMLIGLLISLFIESCQLLINILTQWPNRLVTFDDLLLNSLGFLLGYVIVKKYSKFFHFPFDILVNWLKN